MVTALNLLAALTRGPQPGLEDLITRILEILTTSLEVEAACLMTLSEAGLSLEQLSRHSPAGLEPGLLLARGTGLHDYLARGETTPQVDTDLSLTFPAHPFTLAGMRGYLGVPLVYSSGESFGVLAILSTRPRLPRDGEAAVLSLAGRQIVAAFEWADELSRLREQTKVLESEYLLMHDFASATEVLRTSFDAVAFGVVAQGPDLRVRFANKAAQAILGLRNEEVAARDPVNIFLGMVREDGSPMPQEERPTVLALHNGLPELQTVMGVDTPTQGRIWLLFDAVPVYADDGSINQVVSSFVDITARRNAEEQLRASEERFRTLIENAPVGAYISNQRGTFEVVNAAFCAMCGYSAAELVGHPLSLVRDLPLVRGIELCNDTSGKSVEVEYRTRDGRVIFTLTNAVLLHGADGQALTAAFVIDITERHQTEIQLEHLAHHDTLTELPNRILCMEKLERALVHAQQHHECVGLFFLDLDGFKAVNDTFGHDIGDMLLKAVARRLLHCTRSGDTVSRLAGDEFVVIMPHIGDAGDAEKAAQKILGQIAAPYKLATHDVHISVSIGIALYPTAGVLMSELIKAADTAMYRAKRAGKNTIRLATVRYDEHGPATSLS